MGSERSRPWLMRTYSGHSSAAASNTLYRQNLAKGQTGLSVAFDLPTQTGYDADHVLAAGEVGKVGVPISSIEDMDALFKDLPLDEMNTSMTINATAPWLLALYVALAERRGIEPGKLRGTTQNDIIKEYLARGTYIFPPTPSIRLTTDTIAYTVKHIPKWNPINVCSYHLQEAGALPVQELAYALSTAMTILDDLKSSGKIATEDVSKVVGRVSFFVNAGIRFVEECCKMRAFVQMWDEIAKERYGVQDPKMRRFRYGVQVNSLGLTEQQPENNIQRIVLEMLAVVLSKDARARAVQLPAWNEALGLPRPWDQQWALRIQQVMAYETDLLEYGDILAGSPVIAEKVAELIDGAKQELERITEQGGMLAALDSGYVKRQLVASHARRLRAIESGDLKIVGINAFTETAESPLSGADRTLKVDASAQREQIARLVAHRQNRDNAAVQSALAELKQVAQGEDNIMPVSIRCAHAGVTTGEWSAALREVYGEFRPATGIDIGAIHAGDQDALDVIRKRVVEVNAALGRPLRILVGKPGLDGHSNGAEQIAVKARDAGLEVIYQGIRCTPEELAISAEEEGVHIIGLSVLSGSHLELVEGVLQALAKRGLKLPVVVGGIIPPADAKTLLAAGVAAVYTPKDSDLNKNISEVVEIAFCAHGE